MIKYPFPIKYSEIGNQIRLAWCDEGSGPYTLVFIHGLANYLPVFKYNILGLKSHFRCIGVDLPGNGLSSKDNYPYSMFFYAESLARFIQTEKLEKVVLVGHSMGGHVSMVMALRYPQLVEKLVLLAPSGIEPFTDWEGNIMKTMLNLGSMMYGDAMSLEAAINSSYYHEQKKDAKHIIKELVHLMQGEEGKYWRKMVQSNIEAMLDEQVFKFLPQIQQETLVMLGLHDSFIPNKLMHVSETPQTLAKKAEAQFPNAKVELLKHCGHFLQIEAADKVNDLILNFLSEV